MSKKSEKKQVAEKNKVENPESAPVERLQDHRPAEILSYFRDALAGEEGQGTRLRQHLKALVDSDSFNEFEPLTADGKVPETKKELSVGDGIVCGFGLINKRRVAIVGLDYEVQGGTFSAGNSRKIVRLIHRALEYHLPLIILVDSDGIRSDGGIESLAESVAVFHAFSRCEGEIPRITVLFGNCRQTACFFPGLSDIVIAVEGAAPVDFGGQQPPDARSGAEGVEALVDFYAENETRALEQVVKCLNYLPDNCLEEPFKLSGEPPGSSAKLSEIIPTDKSKPYDVKDLLNAIFDGRSFFESKPRYARNAVTGFARLDGWAVGVVANQPRYRAGTLDVRATDKMASFIAFCDRFNMPVITVVDLPGFLPAADQERRGLIKRASQLLAAYSRSTTPMLTLVTRKSYDASYAVMAPCGLGVDVVLAWPTAEIALTDKEHQGNALYQFGDPWEAARRGYVDNVIKPGETRRYLKQHLEIIFNAG